MKKQETTGLLLAFMCAILWGASYPLSGILAGRIDPVIFAIARYGLATLGLGVAFIFFTKERKWLRVRDIPLMAFSGIAAQAVFFYTSLLALEYISASEVGVINGMIPIFTLLVTIPLYRKLPTVTQALAVMFSFIGAFFIAFDPTNQYTGLNIGHLYMVIGVMGFIVSCFINKNFSDRYDGISTMLYQFLFATIALIIMAFFKGSDFSEMNIVFESKLSLFSVLMLGLVCSGLAYVMYFKSLVLAGVTRANMVQNMIPLSAFILSVVLLGESVTLQKSIGLVLVIGALFLFDMDFDAIKRKLFPSDKQAV